MSGVLPLLFSVKINKKRGAFGVWLIRRVHQARIVYVLD
jgi:hypothetical protein